jgi:hypothetical protein
MVDSEPDARRTLEGLVAQTGTQPTSTSLEQLPYRQVKRQLAEHDPGPAAKPDRGHVFAKSEFFRAPMPGEQVAALVGHIAGGRAAEQSRELDFTPWGGAYNRIRSDATAFAHRSERFLLKHKVVIDPEGAQATPAAREWLARSWALVHPSGAGGAYPNFPDADLDWDRAYHRANLDRLLSIKARYDPAGLFRAGARR